MYSSLNAKEEYVRKTIVITVQCELKIPSLGITDFVGITSQASWCRTFTLVREFSNFTSQPLEIHIISYHQKYECEAQLPSLKIPGFIWNYEVLYYFPLIFVLEMKWHCLYYMY